MKKLQLKTHKFDEVKDLFETFRNHGFELFIVGGAVRDYLLGKNFNDIDFATNAHPEQIKTMFKKTNNIGEKFGTIQVIFNNKPYEITTYREESDYTDQRHPNSLSFSKTIKDDLKRRDFTINALALDENGVVFDYFNGLEDLKNGIINTVGEPFERFNEDGLRKWRCIRLAAEKGFEINPEVHRTLTFEPDTSQISLERIKEELTRILLSEKVNWGGYLLIRTGIYQSLLRRLVPEVLERSEGSQNLIEVFDTIYLLKPHLSLRLAALLLPFTRSEAEHFLKSLGYSKVIIKETLTYLDSISISLEKGIQEFKKVAAKVGKNNLLNLLELQEAIAIVENDRTRRQSIHLAKNYAKKVIKENHPLTRFDLDINGNDLLQLGFKDLQIKNILDFLLNLVYINPNLNKKEILLNLLKNKEVLNAVNISE